MAHLWVFNFSQQIHSLDVDDAILSGINNLKIGMEHELNQISDGLYLSDYESAKNVELLESNKIGAIITIVGKMCVIREMRDVASEINAKFHPIRIRDLPFSQIKKHFIPTIQFILKARKNKKNVLVHCQKGISRSASIVIAYLLHIAEKESYEDILKHVQSKRPIVKPNPGFTIQLKKFADERFKISSNPLKTLSQNSPLTDLAYFNLITCEYKKFLQKYIQMF